MTGSPDSEPQTDQPDALPATPSWPIQLLRQLGRYVGVGIIVTLVDYLVFLLVMHQGLSAPQANAASKVAATLVGAYLHRRYTFTGPQRLNLLRQMFAYAALAAFNLALSTGVIVLLISSMGWSGLVAKLAADLLVIVVSFAVSRVLIYAPAQS